MGAELQKILSARPRGIAVGRLLLVAIVLGALAGGAGAASAQTQDPPERSGQASGGQAPGALKPGAPGEPTDEERSTLFRFPQDDARWPPFRRRQRSIQDTLKNLRKIDVEFAAGKLTTDISENQRWARAVLTEGIAVRGGITMLRADSAVVWFDPKIAAEENKKRKEKGREEAKSPAFLRESQSDLVVNHRAIHGIYAEGDVHLQHGNQVARAQTVYFDVVRKRAVLVDGLVTGVVKRPMGVDVNVPFVLRAEQLRVEWTDNPLGAGQANARLKSLQARTVRVTTCDFGHPHYHVEASGFEMEIDDETGHPVVDLDSTTLNIFGQPVFWLPGLSGDASIVEYFPLRGVSVGDNRRFGTYVETTWSDSIDFRDADGRTRTWGTWTLNVDGRSRRGPGVGLEIDYATDDYFGRVLGYYQRDDNEDLTGPLAPYDPPDNDRGRFRLFHRHQLPFGLELDVESSWIRDRNYLNEYYQGEVRYDKIQENYVYLKRDFDNWSARLLYRPRINDFFTRTEYLPRLSASGIAQPLIPGGFAGTNIYLDVEAEASQTRLRFDEALGLMDREANRADILARLEVPIPIGPIHVTPFFQGQYTSWSETQLDSSKDARSAWTHGFRVFTQFWRTYPNGLFGLDLRHLVMPEVRYTNTYGVDLPISQVLIFDRKDFAAEAEAITARVQQKLQVRLGKLTLDVAELTLENSFFPHKNRDNGGDTAGPMLVDFKAGTERVIVLTEALIDWKEGDAVVLNTGVIAGLGRIPGLKRSNWRVYASHRMSKGLGSVLTLGTTGRLGTKWQFGAFYQYDYRNDTSLDQRYRLERTFHRFRLGTEYYVDGGNGDRGVRFTFAPVEFFNSFKRIERDAQQGIFRGDY